MTGIHEREPAIAARRCAPYLAFALVATLQSNLAHAVDYTWNNPFGGSFRTLLNWSPPPPAPIGITDEDRVTFNLFAAYAVDLVLIPPSNALEPWESLISDSLVVTTGTVTFNLGSVFTAPVPTYDLDTDVGASVIVSSNPGALVVPKLHVVSTVLTARGWLRHNSFLHIGRDADSAGTLEVSKARWTAAGTAFVGLNGTGTLILNDAADFSSAGGLLGFSTTGRGSASLTEGSRWDVQGELSIGSFGRGTLSLVDAAVTATGNVTVAAQAGSSGTVGISSGTLGTDGSLFVGGRNGAAGGTGSFSVFGLDSAVTVDGAFVVWGTGSASVAGDVTVGGALRIEAGGSFDVNGGHLTVGSLDVAPATFDWVSGHLSITAGDFAIGPGTLGGQFLVSDGERHLTVGETLDIGADGAAALFVLADGAVRAGNVHVVSLNPGVSSTAVGVDGATARLTVDDVLRLSGVAGSTGAQLAVSNGGRVDTGETRVADVAGTRGLVSIHGSTWVNAGDVVVGGDAAAPRGSGTVEIGAGSTVGIGGRLIVWTGSQLAIDAAEVSVADLDLSGLLDVGTGTLALSSSTVHIHGGGQLLGRLDGAATTNAVVSGTGSRWQSPGDLHIGSGGGGPGRIASLSLADGGRVDVAGIVQVQTPGALSLAGGAVDADRIDISGDFTGAGELRGRVTIAGDLSATGNLILGDADDLQGVRVTGQIDVGDRDVTLLKKGFFSLGDGTRIAGGKLSAPNGVSIGAGVGMIAHGAIAGRVQAAGGSYLEADGNLTLGDASSLAGYFSDGELVVGAHKVALLDANVAVLGSLTTLGEQGTPGKLAAAKGLLVDFGRNIAGHGEIDTPNDSATPLINNGAIVGDSLVAPLMLTGFVKGVGTFDNVAFTGTLSGGLSPQALALGSAIYAGDLVVELGGTNPGAQHDQYNHSGSAQLGGTLSIVLIDDIVADYRPLLGDWFVIMTADEFIGDFDRIVFPALDSGLRWITTRDTHTFAIGVAAVPLPASLLLLASAALSLPLLRRAR